MKLTALEIQGFKSFADKTRFAFDTGITGIVGPNGCGKSNVIDAIRWVLGEQKTRNLRSDKMENVIFNGTDARRKANLAEVSITFENTKNLLPTEYTVVTVTRRLFRDGDSEYLINNVPCRLKDIHNLFLDTGIGSDSYAIIELGMVDEILNDKNNSRRLLFEEAAGVSRYKIRKKETLSRLEETDVSLSRVDDVLFEIEKNLKSLEKQAKRAEQYFVLREEYKKASSQLAFMRMQELKQSLQTFKEQEDELNDKLTGVQARTAKHDARILELQRELMDHEENLSAEQRRLNDIQDEIKNLESRKEVRNERLKYLKKRALDIEQQIEVGKLQHGDWKRKLAELETQIDEANELYDKQEFYLVELENDLEELKQATHNRRLQVDELNRELKSRESALQNLQKEKEYRSIQINGLENELKRSETERERRADELGSFSEQLEKVTAEVDALKEEIRQARERKEKLEAEIHQTTEAINTAQESLFQTKRKLDATKNEYSLTKSLVDSMEGFPESVKYIKSKMNWAKNAPFISDIFNCDEQYKVAVENYLEPYMNYYIVQNRSEALEAVVLLKNAGKGRANFFMLNDLQAYWQHRQFEETPALPPTLAEVCVPLSELVSFQDKFLPLAHFLLRNAYVYKGELPAEGLEIPDGVALIQQNGSLITRRVATGGGSVGLFEGKRIGRAQNLEKLAAETKRLTELMETEEKALQTLRQKLADLKAVKPERELDDLQRRLNQRQQEFSVLSTKATEYQNVLNNITARATSVEQEIAKLTRQIDDITPKLERLTDEVNTLYQQLAIQQRELQNRTEALNHTNAEFNKENIAFLNTKNAIAGLKKDFRYYFEQIQKSDSSEGLLNDEKEKVLRDIAELENATLAQDDEMVERYKKKEAQENTVRFLEEKAQGVKAAIQKNENFIRDERRQKDEINQEIANLKEKATDYRIKQQGVLERMQVEWQIEVDKLNPDELFDRPYTEFRISEIEAGAMKLRDKYTKFGEVNPTAIETYNEIKERHDFILTQKNDLVEAKNNLLATIHEIDDTAKGKFMEAFDAIRTHFIRVFRTLFTDQDSCDLKLLRPEDPLDSPIEISAKPKGKRPLTINQLSGGEKTLTAISLLFSIYLLKPAPFCIFDEVDAPLDDANIDKFNNIIQEFSKESQFIIVTHNKRTMVKTNVIYGVTMEQTGVSRVLPVDLVTLKLTE